MENFLGLWVKALLRPEVFGHVLEAGLRDDDLAAARGHRLRLQGLDEGLANGQRLRAIENATDVEDAAFSVANANLNRYKKVVTYNGSTYFDGQGDPRQDLQVVHALLDVLGALDGAANRLCAQGLVIYVLGVDRWPHDDHRITDELDDVAAILVEATDHALHVPIDAEGQVLVPLETALRARLRQVGKARDVGEDDDGFHTLQLRQLRFLGGVPALDNLLDHQ